MKKISSILTLICLTACSFSQNKKSGVDKIVLPAGKGASSVEVADFNNDGRADIAIANIADSSLTVYLNQGKRMFEQAKGSPFPAGHFPNDINFSDIDEDGNIDIAIANHERKYFTVLLGNGQGHFTPSRNSPFSVHVKPHTHGVITADFNKDGHLDIATDSWWVDSLVVLNGDGRGNFNDPKYLSTGTHPYQRLRTADFNKDGNADIVTTNLDGNSVTILQGDGKGNFKKIIFDAGIIPFGVAIGDLNADNNLDLAVINSPTISGGKPGKDGLTILTGDGQGNFSILKGSPFETGLGPTRVVICDLNNDGINDIAVSNINSDFVSVYYLNKKGVELSTKLSMSKGSDGNAIGDVDDDGNADIIATSSIDNNATIFFGINKTDKK